MILENKTAIVTGGANSAPATRDETKQRLKHAAGGLA